MKQDTARAPIGIFDSGLGGLTVAKAVMQLLPYEDIVYFGDTARLPYGTKSPASIVRFSRQNAEVLLEYKVKAIVIACNSSASYALRLLKRELDVPVLGVIEPGVKKAVATSRTGRIGIVATPATVASGEYQRQLCRARPGCRVMAQACPLFVPLVEEGWFERDVTRQVAREYLKTLQKARVDTVILGCTHYPLLKATIADVMGEGVSLIDSAVEVARQLEGGLRREGLLRLRARRASHRFLVSDAPEHFRVLAKKFLGRDIALKKKMF